MIEAPHYSASELIAVLSARQLRDGQIVFAGIGTPLLAATLAQRLHCPGLTILFEGGVIGAFTLLLINYLVVRFLFKHRRLDQLVEGKPTVLVENGEVNEKNLAKELLTRAELASVAHR